ncbi:MAG: pyridoxamine 5'-phosphate oxidase family protein [Stackebrandtia sp.]
MNDGGITARRARYDGCGETAGTTDITTQDCVRLLRNSTVGRLGVTDRAMPLILPVHFTVHNDWVVIRTSMDGRMAEASRNNVVAFEVDETDVGTGGGWSVVVVGYANLIDHGARYEVLSALDLPAWAPGHRDGFIVIKMERVSGRRLVFVAESGTGIRT